MAKLFNIVVKAVVCEWMRMMRETLNDTEGSLAEHIAGLFAIFCIDNSYIASGEVEFLQEALDILVKTF